MAHKLDQSKIIASNAEAETRKSGGDEFTWYEMKQGQNRVRILPPWDANGVFAFEKYHHWISNEVQPLCLKGFAGVMACFAPVNAITECPICTVLNEIKSAGHTIDMKPRFSSFMNVIDRNNEAAGPMIMRLPSTGYNPILQALLIPEYGDITDPLGGFDVVISKSGEGLNTKYDVTWIPQRSALFTTVGGTPDMARINDVVGSDDGTVASKLVLLSSIWKYPDAQGLEEMHRQANALRVQYLGGVATPPIQQPTPPAVPAQPIYTPPAPVATPQAPIPPVPTPAPVAQPTPPIAPKTTTEPAKTMAPIPPLPNSTNVPTGQMTPPPPTTAPLPTTSTPIGAPACHGKSYNYSPTVCSACPHQITCKSSMPA